MAEYAIYFHQQWVGDHTEEWFSNRGPLARAVLEEMKAACVYLFGGGLIEELEEAVTADDTSGELRISDGPVRERDEWLGGITIIEAATDDEAKMWAGKIAVACGWPQELRKFKPAPHRQS